MQRLRCRLLQSISLLRRFRLRFTRFFTLDGCTRKSPQHGFIQAITTAFAEHWPLALRPEHIWTLVLQAVARHVDENTEELRERFVAHEGKATLEVPYSEE